MKKNYCICFCISESMLPAVANIIIGIEHYSKHLDASYVIFHMKDEIFKENDLKALHAITNKVEFRSLDFSKYEDSLKNTSLYQNYQKRYGGLIVYAKFFIFNLLTEFHNVLWLDADILIQGDISSIFKFKPMAWRPALIPMTSVKINKASYKFTDKDTRPNAGVIFVSDEIPNYSTLTEECFNILINEIDDLTGALDEIIFGIINHKYSIGAQQLHPRYNCGCGWQNSHRALIVHSIGPNKFWNSAIRFSLFHKWKENNDKWVKLGGTNIASTLNGSEHFVGINLNYINASLENSIYWNNILSDISYPDNIIADKLLFKPEVKFYIRGQSRDIYFSLEKTKSEKKQNSEVIMNINYQSLKDKNLSDLFLENVTRLDNTFKIDTNMCKVVKILSLSNLQHDLGNFFNITTKYIEVFFLQNHLSNNKNIF